jgi:branched-chain amino acid aminotransferase
MAVSIDLKKVKESRIGDLDMANIPFGRIYSDHMLLADYADGAWRDLRIRPYEALALEPATAVFHYGQTIFEGMKAFVNDDADAVLFRPGLNFARFNRSAVRMCMPEIPEEIFLGGLAELVSLDAQWIPNTPDASLYLRPFMIATDGYIGVRPSETYRFMIITCPVGPYYTEPLRVKVETEFIRAAPGGIGSAKAGGNYGGSLYPARLAQQQGYHQLLWTDAIEHAYMEESGTMNVFFVIDDTVLTPAISGTILDGVTRRSAIQLLQDAGYTVAERRISVAEVVQAAGEGRLRDAFGAGTAATIAPIRTIGYQDTDYDLPPAEEREISPFLRRRFDEIRRGTAEDRHGWVVTVEELRDRFRR